MFLARIRALLLIALLATVGAACSTDDGGVIGERDGGGGTSLDDDADDADDADKGSITVASVDFTENVIIAELYAQALEHHGYEVSRKLRLGTREVIYPAFESGEIDLYPEYIGTALEFLNEGAGEASGDVTATAEKLAAELESRDLTLLGVSPAQDQNTLVVTKETADEFDLATVSDLDEHAADLTLGGPPECPDRPFCIPGYEDTYGLEFGSFEPLDAGGGLTKTALENGDIDVALLFSSDGSIAANGWVVLEDDMGLQPADNLAPVARDTVVTDELAEILDEVSEALTTAKLSAMNLAVSEDKEEPEDVAAAFLADEGLLG